MQENEINENQNCPQNSTQNIKQDLGGKKIFGI